MALNCFSLGQWLNSTLSNGFSLHISTTRLSNISTPCNDCIPMSCTFSNCNALPIAVRFSTSRRGTQKPKWRFNPLYGSA